MVTYRYLGSATTDANGVAKYNFTGSGAGEIDYIASLDNPITDGSIVSGTFSVFDCYRHDDGTISSHNDIWTLQNGSLNRDTEYSILKESTVGTTLVCGISNIPFKNYRIECDVYQVDGTQDEWCLNVLNTDYSTITSANMKLGEWKHISLDLNNIAPNSRVRLNTGGSCTELRFKNFMLYPYGDNDVISINASNPVIQSTETTNITGSLFIDGELQKNTNIDVYKNGSKVDTISTGSTGVASYTYTGTGAGATEFQFKYGSIVSETYNVLDCLYLDTATSDKRTNYTIEKLSVTQDTDKYICTRNADGNCFVDLRLSDITAYKNQTIRFKADIVESDKAVQLRIYEITPSSTIVKTTGAGASSGTLQTDAVTISNDATNLYFRFMMGNLGTSESCSFRNFRVYID